MKVYRSLTVRFFSILSLIGLLSAQGVVFAGRPSQQDQPAVPAHFQPVPDQIRSYFEGGITVDNFLQLTGGRIPNAIAQLAGDQEVTVVVQMEAQPLAGVFAQQLLQKAPLTPETQQAYQDSLLNAQANVAQGVQTVGGRVISQYTKAYNGLLIRVPVGQLEAIRQMPGVKAIRRAPVAVPALSRSVAHIRATEVIENLGLDGTGTTIAIIDSGVDYTHAAFGGPGTEEAYETNDPTVIEPGTFPTEKVIGGYDFAGVDYDAASPDPAINTPNPDPDPLDGDGHGTHVASIAAGLAVTPTLGHGVAPGAQIYALKVFGETAVGTETVLHLNAIEWAMDPNQDNDLSDHVDVINMSLGSAYGIASLEDPDTVAVEYASSIGIVVVASAGNSGDVSYITGTPAAADSAISVAASTTGWLTGPTVTISDTAVITQTQIIYAPGNFDEETGHFTETVSAPLMYVGNLFADDLLCSIPPEAEGTQPLQGSVALIQRGVCPFSQKVNNAASLGAVAALIFNHEEGGNTLTTMIGVPVAIPAGFIAHADGLALIQAHGQVVTISAETDVVTVPDPYLPADVIADFSSRGPRALDAFQKPDITAPGVSIFAAKMGSGDEGTSISGTSMSAPHVAGVAALMLQDHPDWAPQQVKAAMMNTAVDLQAGSAAVPRQGAGRVDAFRAVTADALAVGDQDQVSLSWGITPIEEDFYTDRKNITLHDLSGQARTYDLSVVWGEDSFTSGISLTVPISVELTADRRFAYIPVDLTIDATQVPVDFLQLEEYYGYIILSERGDPASPLRVPFYLIPQPHSRLTVTNVEADVPTQSADILLTHQGPVPSEITAYPLYINDENELAQDDMADLRMVGMDAGFTHPEYGDIFVPAINVHGEWFTPQPYFAEFDLFLDVDEDGLPDLVNFNWNAGAAFGTGDDDTWVVVQIDLRLGLLFLGSPFLIFTDYNSGYMEWGLPAAWNGLTVPGNTDFIWQLNAFDAVGNMDQADPRTFDIAHPPFTWTLSNQPGPDNPTATLSVAITDFEGVEISQPLGLMIVDYNGKPGEGQAYAITPENVPNVDIMLP